VARPVGILGGTFDPVHNAHLAIASAALRALGLEKILWLPTGTPPYRPAHRVAMLKLAIANEPRYAVDDRELRQGASGFTYDSVKEMREAYPNAEFTLLLGSDQYAKRESWHRWTDLEKLCGIAVVARPGWNFNGKAKIIPMTPLPFSASDIRARIARDEDVAAMLPAPVLAYIREHGLYR
jgi:nicotinate-nucleotide adenylyltransferase